MARANDPNNPNVRTGGQYSSSSYPGGSAALHSCTMYGRRDGRHVIVLPGLGLHLGKKSSKSDDRDKDTRTSFHFGERYLAVLVAVYPVTRKKVS
jgi:hypothetical protein